MNLVKPLFDLGKKEEKSFNLVGLNHTADLFSKYFAGCCMLVAADSRVIHAHTYTFVN